MDEGRRISIDDLRENLEALRSAVEVANTAAASLGLKVVILKPGADEDIDEAQGTAPKAEKKKRKYKRRKKRRN